VKKFLIAFLILISTSAFGTVGMHINFSKPTIKQGKVEEATLYLDEATAQNFLAKKVTGQTIENTIYLLEVGPLTKADKNFEAEAKVIFLKVPESKVIQYEGVQGNFPVTWSGVEIVPTEATQELIFERFSIPSRKNVLLWLGILIGVSGVLILALRFRKTQRTKAQMRKRRLGLRDELVGGTVYSEIVEIWKKREIFIAEFPEIQDHFKKFEQVLFKYQFKPSQTEAEKIEIMQAYREFLNNVRGGLNGI